jgi:hypothetical protein
MDLKVVAAAETSQEHDFVNSDYQQKIGDLEKMSI